jgi:hypothetical protein
MVDGYLTMVVAPKQQARRRRAEPCN